ncbi:RNase H domain-containing protein [Trichonephila clavipes]|nr:RNase H domain-containing protein [Trichonephila clavipes]
MSAGMISDGLAREGSHKHSAHGGCLIFSEIVTRVKQDVRSSWKQAPVHEWYEGNHPGTTLLGTCSRRDETTLARFCNGHTRAQRHVAGLKVYPSCPNCNVTQAAPAHILACIGCHKSQLLSSPATVLQCLKMHGFMDLI